jgi:hypothetical protein
VNQSRIQKMWQGSRLGIRLSRLLAILSMLVVSGVLSSPAHADEDMPIGRPVERISFRGNIKVESAAIQRALSAEERPGQKPVEVGQQLELKLIQEDIKAIWRMNSFDDVRVEAEEGSEGGLAITYVVREKRTIRKIYVAGNSGSRPRQDQRRPRSKEGHHLRPRQGQAQRREDPRPLRRKGLLPRRREVRGQGLQSPTQLDVYFYRRRARQGRGPQGPLSSAIKQRQRRF